MRRFPNAKAPKPALKIRWNAFYEFMSYEHSRYNINFYNCKNIR